MTSDNRIFVSRRHKHGASERLDLHRGLGRGAVGFRLTAPELQGIALAIYAHVQASFIAERAHHEAIEQLQAQADADANDVMADWPPTSALDRGAIPLDLLRTGC